jgi:hypothetical protein
MLSPLALEARNKLHNDIKTVIQGPLETRTLLGRQIIESGIKLIGDIGKPAIVNI